MFCNVNDLPDLVSVIREIDVGYRQIGLKPLQIPVKNIQ